MQIDVICIDFSKAFDRVSHRKLLFKLRNVGISENVLNWVGAYLGNRQQAVRVGDALSENREVYSGVPQGSVLGPLLFLLYIDDISSVVQPPVKIKLFADDCLIYCPVSCREDQLKINQCLQTLNLWCSKWGMEINIKKSTYTHITKKKEVLSFAYNIGDNMLVKVCSFKYLGVTITDKLSWRSHIENICQSAYQKLCFLRRKLGRATKDIKLLAYKTYVRPKLEYASAVWSPHQKVLKNKLERIQRMSARFICSKYRRRDSVTEMLKVCKLETLELRRQKQRLKMLFQILHAGVKINKDDYLTCSYKRFPRTTRSTFIQPIHVRTDLFQFSFFPDAIKMWNELPNDVVQKSTLSEFEVALDRHFVENV